MTNFMFHNYNGQINALNKYNDYYAFLLYDISISPGLENGTIKMIRFLYSILMQITLADLDLIELVTYET